jgi:tetratricopeptide (TPR) repeat protein
LARYGWQAGEPQLAQHYLEQAQRLAPESSALIAVQALLAFGRRDHRRAERLARAALAGPLSAEDNVTLRVALADYYSKTGRHLDAIEQLDAAILHYPHNGRLYQRRGLAKRALGQGAAARVDFERAIAYARSEADRFEAQRALRATGAPER